MATVAPKLKYSLFNDTYGWVDPTPTFNDECNLVKLDLLCDWISGLQKMYEDALVDSYRQYKIPKENVEPFIDTMVDEFVSTFENNPEKMLQWIKDRAKSDFESMKPNDLVSISLEYNININDFKITKK